MRNDRVVRYTANSRILSDLSDSITKVGRQSRARWRGGERRPGSFKLQTLITGTDMCNPVTRGADVRGDSLRDCRPRIHRTTARK